MLLFRFFTWLATIFAAALAAPPIVQRQPAPGPDPQKAYYLKAKVIGGDRSEDGLYCMTLLRNKFLLTKTLSDGRIRGSGLRLWSFRSPKRSHSLLCERRAIPGILESRLYLASEHCPRKLVHNWHEGSSMRKNLYLII